MPLSTALIMSDTFLLSQLLVSLALLLDLLSFQLRHKQQTLLCLALSCLLNAGHFLLLSQPNAALLLLLASCRFLTSAVFPSPRWHRFYLLLAPATLLWLGSTPLAWLATAANMLQTHAAFQTGARKLRYWMLAGTLCWLLNNALLGSPVAVIMEGFFAASILLSLWRQRRSDFD